MRFFLVGLNALTGLIHQPDLHLRYFVTFLCGHAIPRQRLGVIKCNTIAVLMNNCQIVGCIDIALVSPALPDGDGLGRFPPFVQLCSMSQIIVGRAGLTRKCNQ